MPADHVQDFIPRVNGPNFDNLTQINCQNVFIDESTSLKCLYLNARSCNNKVTEINDLIIEKNADLVFITETWFKDKDNTTISNLLPYGFEIIYKNRQSRSGGGVAIIYRSTLDIIKCDITNDFCTFESFYLKIKSQCLKHCFFCMYLSVSKK